MKTVVSTQGLQPVIPAPTPNQPLNGRQQPTLVARTPAIVSSKGLQPVGSYKRQART